MAILSLEKAVVRFHSVGGDIPTWFGFGKQVAKYPTESNSGQ